MSQRTLYLGPYAEWLLRPREYEAIFPLEPFWGHDPFWLLLDGKLVAAWSRGLPPEIKVRGKPRRRFPFIPYQFPPVRALRELRRDQGGVCGVADLRDLDGRSMQAEMTWFARTYAAELRQLGEHMGQAATLHWGIVAWEHD
jgi:hypothetical protein